MNGNPEKCPVCAWLERKLRQYESQYKAWKLLGDRDRAMLVRAEREVSETYGFHLAYYHPDETSFEMRPEVN